MVYAIAVRELRSAPKAASLAAFKLQVIGFGDIVEDRSETQ